MSLRKAFSTSSHLEEKGVALQLGNTRITMKRTGSSSNAKFNAGLQSIHREFKIAMENELMSEKRVRLRLVSEFVEHVVTDWETNVGDESNENWVDGIEAPGWDDDKPETRTVVPFTSENAISAFLEMEDLFKACFDFSKDKANYLRALLDLQAKN